MIGDAGCLSAYLSFEHVYNNVVYDESHNGNPGTMHGCAQIVNDGKFGKALLLGKDGNVTFDVETFHNRPTDAITIALWLNLSDVSGSHELFFTCGTPVLYNMGDYHFEIDNGTVRWFEELLGGNTRFNISSSKSRLPLVQVHKAVLAMFANSPFYPKCWDKGNKTEDVKRMA